MRQFRKAVKRAKVQWSKPALRPGGAQVSRRLLNDGAQAIMLGGTDLALVYDQQTSEFPLIDCASIHVDAIVRLVLG